MDEELVRNPKVLEAVKLFESGLLSSGQAAELSGMTRVEFLLALRHFQISPFQLTEDDLSQDVLNA